MATQIDSSVMGKDLIPAQALPLSMTKVRFRVPTWGIDFRGRGRWDGAIVLGLCQAMAKHKYSCLTWDNFYQTP